MKRTSAAQLTKLIEDVMEEYSVGRDRAILKIAAEVDINTQTIANTGTLRWSLYRLAKIVLLDEDPGKARNAPKEDEDE